MYQSESITESGINTCLCQKSFWLWSLLRIKHRLERLDNLNYLACISLITNVVHWSSYKLMSQQTWLGSIPALALRFLTVFSNAVNMCRCFATSFAKIIFTIENYQSVQNYVHNAHKIQNNVNLLCMAEPPWGMG